jgi:hypothetical protein
MVKATSSIEPLRPISTTNATDPVYAAIETHKAADRAHRDAITLTDKLQMELPRHLRQSDIRAGVSKIVETDDPRWIVAEQAEQDTCEESVSVADATMGTRPTTLQGAIAFLRHSHEFRDNYDWVLAASKSAAEALETITSAATDPIFAVLAENRAAMKAYLAASAISGNLADGTPEWETANTVTQAAIKREHAAMYAVLTGQPSTVAGVIALLEHVGEDQFLGEAPEGKGKDIFDETVLSVWMDADDSPFKTAAQELPLRIAATVRTLNGAPFAAADGRLIELGNKLEAAWAEQKRVGVSRLVDEILAIPAQTLPGLRVKAHALLWCQSGEPWAQENPPRIPLDWQRPAKTTDDKLIESILADLLRGQRNLDAPLSR